MTLSFQLLRPGAALPERATPGSAGLDLRACLDAPLSLPAGGIAVVPTGLAVALPPGTVGLVCGRSGLGIRHGVAPANAVGVIDSDYRGEIRIGLINHSQTDYTIAPDERVAQLLVAPVLLPDPVQADRLPETARGAGGFGSTGRG